MIRSMHRCWTSNTMLAVLSIGILHVGSFGQASFAAFTLDPHMPPLDNLALGSLSGRKLKIFDRKNLSLVPSLDIVAEVVCFLPFDSLYTQTPPIFWWWRGRGVRGAARSRLTHRSTRQKFISSSRFICRMWSC